MNMRPIPKILGMGLFMCLATHNIYISSLLAAQNSI